MLILQLCKDMFDEMPNVPDIHKFFHTKREEYNDDRKFFLSVIQFLGGRSYNNFMDYSLLAIKLTYIHNKYIPRSYHTWEHMKDGIEYLLGDDRHDLWQNLPYILDDVIKGTKEIIGPQFSDEQINKFWEAVVTAIIECINTDGTGDKSVQIKYPL